MRTACCLAVTLAAALLAPQSLAQDEYRWEKSDASKVRFKVFKKLASVPLKLGDSRTEYKMKFEPPDAGDRIWGKYGSFSWTLLLLDFKKPTEKTTTTGGKGPVESEAAKAAADFREWVTERDEESHDRKFVTKGVDAKAKGKNPAHKWWEFTDSHKMTNGREVFDQLWWNAGAVYTLEGREVALVCRVPIKKGERPDPKHVTWIETMLKSVETIEGAEGEADEDREKFANTPERKTALEAAKANIANLKGWDFFTSPNYIVLYSWDAPPADPTGKRREGIKFAKDLIQKLEDVRELYVKQFPPHDKVVQPYSVLRICESYPEFCKYSEIPQDRTTIGWFSPRTKELVVFEDSQHEFKMNVVTVTCHEGWHQYADSYFGGERTELHRWFDEGHGDYFGSFTKKGSSWSYSAEKGRHNAIRSMISRKTFVPLREIVTWNKDKYYDKARGGEYYAEGYSLVDFLRRGPDVLGKKFDERWTKIIPIYTSTMLETKDQKKAVEAAYAGVDWDQFEATWIEWVRNSMK
jgi:hypothetical protein